jgi:hypothetical protein
MIIHGFFRRCRRGKAIVLFVFYSLIQSAGLGQDIQVKGGFLSDSLKIGERTAYYLSAHYPSALTILFPDSTFAFSPFEYVGKEYFPTKTTGGISRDSAVYFLTTFEVDRAQYLELPVYVIHEKDCTLNRPARDSVLISQFVAHVPDSVSLDKLPLKMNTAYQKVFLNFNFWVVIIVVAGLLTGVILIWVVFGKEIRRYFRTQRLQKNHLQFVESYNRFLSELQSAFSALKTESALSVWKKYMEQLEARPYTKLTTRETVNIVKEPVLTEHLSQIDRAIYGHNTSVLDSLKELRSFADQQFARKIKEVKHGK